ncbi:transport and Golgi organization 2 homolog isoform X1 [Amphiura filiformis]|uniref:transport and Golgi organization 2 homolog isoform X1 n=1 Tax=Amphiura filiformis TaxID=82378 RepID=UPI003B223A1D
MCITAFVFGLVSKTQKKGYRLILAFNRDEFYARPAKPASFWATNGDIIGGMDMTPGKEGGTWLSLSKTGRLALLLNIRRLDGFVDPDAKGRGSLVKDFVEGSQGCEEYLQGIAEEGEQYNGFNLVTADLTDKDEVYYYSNKSGSPPEKLQPGAYGISNSLLASPWMKATHAKDSLSDIANVAEQPKERLTEEILKVMRNDVPLSHDKPLDESSITLEKLYAVAPELLCVKTPVYGTRSHTVILVDTQGEVTYTESYLLEPIDARNRQWKTESVTFSLKD